MLATRATGVQPDLPGRRRRSQESWSPGGCHIYGPSSSEMGLVTSPGPPAFPMSHTSSASEAPPAEAFLLGGHHQRPCPSRELVMGLVSSSSASTTRTWHCQRNCRASALVAAAVAAVAAAAETAAAAAAAFALAALGKLDDGGQAVAAEGVPIEAAVAVAVAVSTVVTAAAAVAAVAAASGLPDLLVLRPQARCCLHSTRPKFEQCGCTA